MKKSMTNYYEKRRTIFNKYASNLKMLVNERLLPGINLQFENTYICPLCLEQFSEEALNGHFHNPLTLEDVPPVALGGTANILTCKSCNNTCGYEVDVHLITRLKEMKNLEFEPGTSFQAGIKFEGIQLKGKIDVDQKNRITLFLSGKNNDIRSVNEFNSQIATGKFPRELNMIHYNKKKIDYPRIDVALLKICYLLAFQNFGYHFILDPFFEKIRMQIRFPNTQIFTSDFWSSYPKQPMPFGTYTGYARSNNFIFSFFPLTLKKKSTLMVMCILPFPSYFNILKSTSFAVQAFNSIRIEGLNLTLVPGDFLLDIRSNKRLNVFLEQQRKYQIGFDRN